MKNVLRPTKWRAIQIALFCVAMASACWLAPQVSGQDQLHDAYEKREYTIAMRDGVKLYTAVYIPKDRSQSYPMLMFRTPYSCRPYGEDQFPGRIGPSAIMEQEGYIFVRQDVRGRWMSEGTYDNMRPHVPGELPIDESSDTYDTIQWLLENVPGNNGKVGIWGISYPGFYAAAALPEHHPALVAASPQAPISDFFFDDFRHHGAFLLSYFGATATFGYQHSGPSAEIWYLSPVPISQDAWTYYQDLIPLAEQSAKYYGEDNFFWQQILEHPNYDEFWQRRNILPHLHNVKTAVMTVGGWFDAEDLYGPLNIYRHLEKNNPDTYNILVMGPWGHGDWARNPPVQTVSRMPFGRELSEFYKRDIEAPFFRHFLKGVGQPPRFEALVFDTGLRRWSEFAQWPPSSAQSARLYLRSAGRLSPTPPDDADEEFSAYHSDPMNPVPYRRREDIRIQFTPRAYMADCQKFALDRPDVLVFQTEPLVEALTVIGDMMAHLQVSTSQSDADWVVKLIDVYPDDHPNLDGTPEGVELAGYHLMVRSEVIRGRFRNSYEHPEPFVPGAPTTVRLPLQDVYHTFKPGHRIMVQVQSTWFPLIDVNPQKYVDNIFRANRDDFTPAEHRVFHSPDHSTFLEWRVLPRQD
ncbi:MAG TPA: CocE/NonD family hydrolase [Pirellulaceae bacterium]|nr:CocE/NonD family hydrolase [Pirellulaceae bacterium]